MKRYDETTKRQNNKRLQTDVVRDESNLWNDESKRPAIQSNRQDDETNSRTDESTIVMNKIKKWALTNYKTSEVEKKRNLNTISWNLRLILSLRA